jgi:elongation of very long chain fatty acids protein 4
MQIFFALRKKEKQITVLHVFHHSTMFPYGWLGIKYVGGGQTFFLCMLNSLVHTVMYAYYMFAAFGPHMQPYLWWKKYLTQLQLVTNLNSQITGHAFLSAKFDFLNISNM